MYYARESDVLQGYIHYFYINIYFKPDSRLRYYEKECRVLTLDSEHFFEQFLHGGINLAIVGLKWQCPKI
jgi:hypothetical protein